MFSWGNKSNGRLGLDSNLDSKNALCSPKPIFGSLHSVSDLNSRYWHSIMIGEQLIDVKSVRIKKTESSNNDAPLSSEVIDSAYMSLFPNSEDFNDNRDDYGLNQNRNLFPSDFILPETNEDDDSSEVPPWLQQDLNDAEFIPMSALDRSQKEATKSSEESSQPTLMTVSGLKLFFKIFQNFFRIF